MEQWAGQFRVDFFFSIFLDHTTQFQMLINKERLTKPIFILRDI